MDSTKKGKKVSNGHARRAKYSMDGQGAESEVARICISEGMQRKCCWEEKGEEKEGTTKKKVVGSSEGGLEEKKSGLRRPTVLLSIYSLKIFQIYDMLFILLPYFLYPPGV